MTYKYAVVGHVTGDSELIQICNPQTSNSCREVRLIGGSRNDGIISGLAVRLAYYQEGYRSGCIIEDGINLIHIGPNNWQIRLRGRIPPLISRMIVSFVNEHDGLPHIDNK